MKQFFRKLIKSVAYIGAAIVIVLAIAVGIFRLMLPRLPEYQEEIKDWASAAIGMSVEFSGMNARWRLSGPELSFFDAALRAGDAPANALTAEEVSIGVGLLRLIADRELVVDRVTIRDSAIDLRQDQDGRWMLQGIALEELLEGREMTDDGGRVEVIGVDVDVDFEHPSSGQLVQFAVSSLRVTRNSEEISIEADLDLPAAFGDRMEVSANRRLTAGPGDQWRLYVEADALNLAGWSRLDPVRLPEINTGVADFVLWFDVADQAVERATANVVVTNLSARAGSLIPVFGLQGSFEYSLEPDGQLVQFAVSSLRVTRNSEEISIEADLDLPAAFGDRMEVSANRRLTAGPGDQWRLYVEADALNLAGWSRLDPVRLPEINTGVADFVLWFDVADQAVERATANVVVTNLSARAGSLMPVFGLQGSFEYSLEPDGWLLGANQFRLNTVEGNWPQSSLQVRMLHNADGEVDGVRGTASYFDLEDLRYFDTWMPEDIRQRVSSLALSGVTRDLQIEVTDIGSESPQFNLSADLDAAGVAPVDGWPGVREFSGRVRAGRDGGRVEIESSNLMLDLVDHLPAPIVLDDALGTVIWRRNNDGMIILSDSVQIRNADFDSQVSLQVSLPAGDGSPVIDFDSDWSVFNMGAVQNYLPIKLITPKLYQWLSDALVSGYVRNGTTRFNGALADFPFEDGSGIFRIEARIEDALIRFARDWPAPQFHHLDLVVENTRMYSQENLAINVGNFVEDASIEIADLREPILEIDAFATGTLRSIRDYAEQSPVSRVFGGQLSRVDVDGDASFDLSITLPIQNARDYEFMTRIRSSDGTVSLQGFPAAISELNGTVTITRDDITSDALFGRFLGYPVDLTLSREGDQAAPHNVILEGRGQTTTEALAAEFGLPLDDIVEGDTDYHATVRFPNGRSPAPGNLQVIVESDLYGFQSNLPEPFAKSDDVAYPMTANIEFPAPDEIMTSGSLAGSINWTSRFIKAGDAWDFDRGVVAVGEYPRDANSRGLHLHGQMSSLHLHDWLAVSRRDERGAGLGERIRSIDVGIDRFYAMGQKFTDHRVEVNRSGRDWVITISGQEAQGLITVPYDFSAGRSMMLELERLILPGDDTAGERQPAGPVDPRVLPSISIRAEEFALGNRFFGSLEAEFERTNRGLESTVLRTEDDSFVMTGAAGWVIDAYEETGQHTFINATVASTDVQRTAARLDYDPGIISDQLQMTLDLRWAGGPRRDFMSVLNGDVSVNLGAGSMVEVNPGAGRVFGLMSLTALPRRLSLDFSDVFDRGFSFDSIAGDFRLDGGDAYTCNLTLIGPAADVGIVGRTGLTTRDYDQAAIVSANFGSTLPVAGFFLGGPQVAAALLVFSQIFREPLKDVGQIAYTISGSWDDPGIDSTTDTDIISAVGSRSGCLDRE